MVDIRRLRLRRATRVIAAITAAVAAGSLAVACTASTTTHAGPTEDAPKPTVVLVHGAFADGSSWNDVIDKLRKDRYPDVAASNPLRGPASDAAALRGSISPVAAQRLMAERAHFHVTEVAASHSVAVSHPDLVAV
ncbi:hypothetical protein [Nocardia sp. NPDC049707]|uniref:hypothetical protein n=1 Tax=Nocardia sp. NPDC049707 TaxID=3154735 RepID=UPI00343144B8